MIANTIERDRIELRPPNEHKSWPSYSGQLMTRVPRDVDRAAVEPELKLVRPSISGASMLGDLLLVRRGYGIGF